MAQSSSFLTRRGWPTTILTNVSKAVEYIAEHRPDFVLLSFTHPSPAMLKLDDLITQNFNLTCVGMVETNDSQSVSKLKESKVRHKVQGAPSGPNLQRVIRRILTEKINAASEANPRARTEDGSVIDSTANHSVTIKGNDSVTVRGGNTNTVSIAGDEPIARLSGLDGSEFNNVDADSDETISTGTYTMTSSNRRSLKSLLSTNEPSGKSDVLMAKLKESLFGDQPADADIFDDDDVAIATIAAARELEASGQLGDSAKSWSSNPPASHGGMTSGQGLSSGRSSGDDVVTSKPSAGKSDTPAARAPVSPMPTQPVAASTDLDALGAQVDTGAVDPTPENILRRALENTLRRVCTPAVGAPAKTLGVVEKVAVFSLESSTVSGYLVIAVEQDANKIEDFFLKACENALREELTSLKVAASLENGFWVHIPAVEFLAWAGTKARFHVTMSHEKSQAAIAFFPMARQPRAQLASDEQQMFSIALDDISTDHPINFKAYLHLKINDKYFLYLRNGRQLQPEQKSRLKDRKVDNIFMKGVDVENLNMFLAASFLRNSIKAAG